VRKLALILICGSITAAACGPAHQDYARSALQEGRLNDAASQVQLALARHPDDPQVRSLAAQIYTASGAHLFEQGKLQAAAAEFHQAIQYDPNYGAAYDYLGQIAFAQHDWPNAISYGERGAALQNHSMPVYVVRARESLQAEGNAGGKAAAQ
jgi:tetratricopeptide (TPR) repeat protein